MPFFYDLAGGNYLLFHFGGVLIKKIFILRMSLLIDHNSFFILLGLIKSLEVMYLKADIFYRKMSKKLSVPLLCYKSCISLLCLVCFGLFLMGKGINDIIDLMLLVFVVVCCLCGLL